MVVGAGMSGLMAASMLAPTMDVVVLEAGARPGGRVESVRNGDYWVNVGTQFAEGTGILFDAMDRFGVERLSLVDKKATLLFNGRRVAMDHPAALVLRSRIPMRARLDLARFGLRVRRAHKRLTANKNRDDRHAFRLEMDNTSASILADGVKSEEVLRLFSDLSGQWIGCEPAETAASQLIFSIGTALNKASAVPNFSLPVGGNQTLVEEIAGELGDRVRLESEVQSVTWTEDGVTVTYRDARGVGIVHAKRAIVAVPADRVLDIMPELPGEQRAAFGAISYGRYVLVGMFTSEQGAQWWDDYYCVVTPQCSFQEVFNHAAALRGTGPRQPGGALVCLSGGGRADEQFEMSDEEIIDAYTRDLLKVMPELKGKIEQVVVRRHRRVVPFWGPGGRDSVRLLREPMGPICFAGDYLFGIPSMADAAHSGARAAGLIKDQLGDLA